MTTLTLTGDFQMAPGFNLNGIDTTPNGKTLIAVQSNTGKLFRIDPETGETTEIVLADGEAVPMGDGILLDGHTLYVVQNRLNVVATIALSPDMETGTVISRTGNADFSVPTTIAERGDVLYAANARFGVANPSGEFWVTGFPKP